MTTKSLTNASLMMMLAGLETDDALTVHVEGVGARQIIFEIKPRIPDGAPPSVQLAIQQSRGYLLAAAREDAADHVRYIGPFLWVEGADARTRLVFAHAQQYAWIRAYWPAAPVDKFTRALQAYYTDAAIGDDVIPVVHPFTTRDRGED